MVPPTTWLVMFQLNTRILLYFSAFIGLTLSNKIGLFGLICLYLRIFATIYWTADTVDSLAHQSVIYQSRYTGPLLAFANYLPYLDMS